LNGKLDQIDVIASVSEPNHENISENMDVVQNVNHEQADTVQISPEFDNEFFRMSELRLNTSLFVAPSPRMVKPYFILFSLRSTLLIIDLREFGSYSPPSFLRTVIIT
jgi:hypothetical protein